MTEPVLRIKNLTKAFGGLVAVDKVNFELPGGDLRAIIGPVSYTHLRAHET